MNLCRLCQGTLNHQFTLTLLGRHEVAFFKCGECHSLQTETPYWLEEAYANNNLSYLDTGAAQRNITNLAACFFISKLLHGSNVLDIGGGDGLLCRMLRDYKINCFVKDKYAQPSYAQAFTEENFSKPDMVLGFEVIEHFANPQMDLNELFQFDARVLLLSTAVYDRQQKDWWYLVPNSGQHIFFYSKKALQWIAHHYHYEFLMSGGYILFVKDISPWKKWVARIALSKIGCRLLRAAIVLFPTPGVKRDQEYLTQKSKLTP